MDAQRLSAWEASVAGAAQARGLRPLSFFAQAYHAFHVITGNTVTKTLRECSGRRSGKVAVYQVLYQRFCVAERPLARALVVARLRARGLQWNPVEASLRAMPSTIPGEHRIAMMRRLLNGELTSRRLVPVLQQPVRGCPFCKAPESDSVEHRTHLARCPDKPFARACVADVCAALAPRVAQWRGAAPICVFVLRPLCASATFVANRSTVFLATGSGHACQTAVRGPLDHGQPC